jgi:hypothetical protein
LIKNFLVIAALVLLGSGALFADPDQPHWLLNADGAMGEELEPAQFANEPFAGGGVAAEWMPDQYFGIDLGYDYLSVGKIPNVGADNDAVLSLRILPVSIGIATLTLEGGGGYNPTPNIINTRYMAFAGPGLRVAVAPYLAIDAGVNYQVTAPITGVRQGLEVTLGIAVPLDAPFAVFSPSSASTPQEAAQEQTEATPEPTEEATPEATPVAVATPVPTEAPTPAVNASGLACYVVQKGDYLWKIAGNPNVFGDSRLWPLLLETNSDKIEDQDFLKPGLILSYKRSYTTAEIASARKKEWFTPAFEPPQWLRGNPEP